jgi:predicted NUDIX family phosphoesterase
MHPENVKEKAEEEARWRLPRASGGGSAGRAPEEEVLVVPRGDLFAPPRREVQGFLEGVADEYLAAASVRGRFLPRPQAEVDPGFKQLIPYGVLRCRDLVFLMRRSSRGGEARLRRKVSLGVGGHVNPGDLRLDGGKLGPTSVVEAIEAAFRRELEEELCVEAPYRARAAGVINDDSNPVGAVHFGIVFRVEVAEPRVRIREAENLEGSFVPVAVAGGFREEMESWSRILLDRLSSGGDAGG